jgi:glycine/D-amino acid oxidase-like deaminating enzyme
MSVQSALELLSAAFTVDSGFSEATILELGVQCRPAFSNNLPHIQVQPGLMSINGLYRHGFLIAPQLATLASQYLSKQTILPLFTSIIKDTVYNEPNYQWTNTNYRDTSDPTHAAVPLGV